MADTSDVVDLSCGSIVSERHACPGLVEGWFSMFCRALSKEALPVLFHFFS